MSGLANIIFESNNYTRTHPFNEPWRYAFRVRHLSSDGMLDVHNTTPVALPAN